MIARPPVIFTDHAEERLLDRGVDRGSLVDMIGAPLLSGACDADERYAPGAVRWASGAVISGTRRQWITAIYVVDRDSKVLLTCYMGPPGQRTTVAALRKTKPPRETVT